MILSWLIYSLLIKYYIWSIFIGILFLLSIIGIIRIDILKKNKIKNIISIRHYRRKLNKLIKVNFVDDYDILKEIFESEDNVIKIMARFDEYDRDKQILIKILLNISKSLK